MNPLFSYLRYLIVTSLVLLAEKLALPAEGLAEAADFVALVVVGSASWFFVKYVAPRFKPKPKNKLP